MPISITTKGPRTSVSIVSKAKYAILAYLFIIVLIKDVNLPNNRNLIFKPK